MKIINLYGGPGIGKSTIAAELFSVMKNNGFKVELVTEFAKDLTYGEDFFKLKDQLLVTAEQNHRLLRLKGKVDYVVTDSPLILGLIYFCETGNIRKSTFKTMVMDLYNSYNNINFLIERNTIMPYRQYGRTQTFEESIEKDIEILSVLEELNIEKICTQRNKDTVNFIINNIQGG